MRCEFWRLDEFGRKSTYAFAFWGENSRSEASVKSAQQWANRKHTTLILVSDVGGFPPPADVTHLTSHEYFTKLGGRSPSYCVLQPDFSGVLTTSGKNDLPSSYTGKPDTIFENYVHAGLQFLLPARVIQYGQERNFKALPDGIALGDHAFNLIYDAKAAKNGYEVTSTTIRQFKDYVEDFNRHYSHARGRVSSFLVVSGSFKGGDRAMKNRQEELLSECGVGLCFLTAQDLADIVALLIAAAAYRQTIPWKRLLAKPQLTKSVVESSLKERQKDGILSQ